MMKDEKEVLVKLENVSRYFKMGDQKIHALNKVNLEIGKGEFILILGPSGSGKTTLLNQIGGIDKPNEGKVIVGGKDISHLPDNELTKYRAKTIGWVFQFFNLIPSLNAWENVALSLELSGNTMDMEKRSKEILARVGLKEKTDLFPPQMSGGEQQRVALCRALIKSPLLIIADEPTGNLDHKTGLEIVSLMKELNREEGTTFVVVSHDESLKAVADRVLHLVDGQIVEDHKQSPKAMGAS